MHESLIDDDDLLNEEDGLGGEGEGAAGGSAEDADGGDDEVANQRRRRAREHERRRKERKREERDAKAVAMVLKAQEAQAQGGEGHLSEKELKKLNHKKLRQHAQDVGVDKDEMDEMYKEEDAKRDWAAILAALKRLAQEARPESRMLIIATLALFVDTCVGLAIPAFFGKILDTASAGQSALQPPSIGGSPAPEPDCQNASGAEGGAAAVAAIEEGRLATCLSLIALTVIGSLCGATRDILFSVTGQRVVLRLRKRLFKHMMQQDVAFFDKTKSGELVNRLSADVMMLKSAVEHSWAQFISSLVSLVATLFYLFFVSWKLTLLMMATPPAIIIIGGAYGAYLERVAKATQDALAGATDSASESISGLRTVRAFANERTRLAQYIANVQMSYTLGVKVAVSGGIFGSFMGLVVGCAIGLILYVGAGLVIDGEMTAGTLTSYLIYCMVLAGSMGGLAGTYGAVMTAAGANRRVFELLDGPPPRIPLEEGRVLDHTALRCSLRFKDVCFSYPTRPAQTVLHNVSFSVEAGQKVALVGRSGCGKSTIMNLIMRFVSAAAHAQACSTVSKPEAAVCSTTRRPARSASLGSLFVSCNRPGCTATSGWSLRSRCCLVARSRRISPLGWRRRTTGPQPRRRRKQPWPRRCPLPSRQWRRRARLWASSAGDARRRPPWTAGSRRPIRRWVGRGRRRRSSRRTRR